MDSCCEAMGCRAAASVRPKRYGLSARLPVGRSYPLLSLTITLQLIELNYSALQSYSLYKPPFRDCDLNHTTPASGHDITVGDQASLEVAAETLMIGAQPHLCRDSAETAKVIPHFEERETDQFHEHCRTSSQIVRQKCIESNL